MHSLTVSKEDSAITSEKGGMDVWPSHMYLQTWVTGLLRIMYLQVVLKK